MRICLSCCARDTYVHSVPHWHFTPANGYNVAQITDRHSVKPWIIEALEQAMRRHGAPKHIISDQAPVFTGDAFAGSLRQWDIKPRFEAVGKSGSIAVTERVIKTLKYEWLRCVPIIKGFDHLMSLCTEFESWYNAWRPHMTLDGFRPDDVYYGPKLETPNRKAKTVPNNIERHVFTGTRRTGYRLKNAA